MISSPGKIARRVSCLCPGNSTQSARANSALGRAKFKSPTRIAAPASKHNKTPRSPPQQSRSNCHKDYKAHLLCYSASVEGLKAREPGDESLTANVFSTILSELPQAENQSIEAYYQVMAQGLLSMTAWDDMLGLTSTGIPG